MANLILLILDGFGINPNPKHNAIKAAKTPQWDAWWENKSHILLDASGNAVGLPEQQMGNSEVGHMHIGAGRLIPQDLTRINQAITNQSFLNNPLFLETLKNLKNTNKAIHVMGLFSPGGVHSHEDHLMAFLDICKQNQFNDVYCHLFTDGRDTPPQSITQSLHKLKPYPSIKLASLSGRYYAMDRDMRLERTQKIIDLLSHPCADIPQFESAEELINHYYQQNIYDEFFPPSRLKDFKPIEDGDAVFFFNFRSDRARQLTQALRNQCNLSHFISMTQYSADLDTEIVFPPFTPQNTLGEIISAHGLKQLRIAETEKYAHVTFFFNGGREEPFLNEDRILIPSPKVSTYDLQPEMNAPLLTQALISAIQEQKYDVIICNYANADMVGHTGNFNATTHAIEALDQAMHEIGIALKQFGGQLLITADHGNAECMFDDKTGQSHTAHTNSLVPFLFVDLTKESDKSHSKTGSIWQLTQTTPGQLIDIAPTILKLLNIPIPAEMTGHTLLLNKQINKISK